MSTVACDTADQAAIGVMAYKPKTTHRWRSSLTGCVRTYVLRPRKCFQNLCVGFQLVSHAVASNNVAEVARGG